MLWTNILNIVDKYPQYCGRISPMLGTIFKCRFFTFYPCSFQSFFAFLKTFYTFAFVSSKAPARGMRRQLYEKINGSV